MGIEGHRVGTTEPGEGPAPSLGEHEKSTVGSVGVQPQVMMLGHVGQAFEIVDGAGVGGAGVGDDQERLETLFTIPRQSAARGSAIRMRKRSSDGTGRTLRSGKPASRAALTTEW